MVSIAEKLRAFAKTKELAAELVRATHARTGDFETALTTYFAAMLRELDALGVVTLSKAEPGAADPLSCGVPELEQLKSEHKLSAAHACAIVVLAMLQTFEAMGLLKINHPKVLELLARALVK